MSSPRADSRALRRQMRSWRRDRANTTLYEQLSEAYIWVFSTVLIGAMAISALIQTRLSVAAECTTAACGDARTSLLWASTLGAVAAAVAIAGALGPVMISAAMGSWLLSTPIDRRPLLRGRLAAAAFIAALLTGICVATAALLAGLPVSALATWSVSAALAAVSVTMLAASWQRGQSHRARNTAIVLATTAWVGTLAIALGHAPTTHVDWLSGPTGTTVLVGTAVLAVALAARALRHVGDLRRAELTASGTVLSSMSGALAGLDFALAYDVLLARKWRSAATVRPVRGGPSGVWAIVWRDVVRLRRTSATVVAFASTLVIPYVLVALNLEATIIPISAFTALLCGLWLFPALRTVANSPGLVRSFPMPIVAVRTATLAVPGTIVVAWALAASPAISHGVVGTTGDVIAVALATGAAALGAITRLLLAGPPNYSTPLITSPAGAIPPGLLISSLRGFDVLALGTIPLLVAPDADGALIAIGLVGVVMAFLLNRR